MTVGTTAVSFEQAEALLEQAQNVYDRAAAVWRYAQAIDEQFKTIPLRDSECPCGCGRTSATWPADQLCRVASDLYVGLQKALRPAVQPR